MRGETSTFWTLYVIWLSSLRQPDTHVPHFEGSGRDTSSKCGEVVLVAVTGFFNKTVFSKPFEHSGNLPGILSWQAVAQIAVAEAADVEFAANDDPKKIEVVTMKQIETSIAAIVGTSRARDFFQVLDAVAGIVDGRDEREIAAIGTSKKTGEIRQAVDGFFDRRELSGLGPIAVYHLAVVFEKRDVVGGGFDTEHYALLVVHLDGGLSHVMSDACALDTGVKIIADFIPGGVGELATQKGGDVIGLDSMDGGADQFIVNGLEILSPFEDDVGGVFDLHQAPVIAGLEMSDDGTVRIGDLIQPFVQPVGPDGISQPLRSFRVVDPNERVVQHGMTDPLLLEFSRQLVVPVEIKLQTQRRPRGNAQITQSEIGEDEVEVVMQALPGRRLEKGLVRSLIMPGSESRTRLHGREYMDQPGVVAAFFNDGANACLLAEVDLPDELNLQIVLPRQGLCMFPQLLPVPIRPVRVIEDAHIRLVKESRHGLGMPHIDQSAGDDNSVIARQGKGNLVSVTFGKMAHGSSITAGAAPCSWQMDQAA